MRHFAFVAAAIIAAFVLITTASPTPRVAYALTNCDVPDFSVDQNEQLVLGLINAYRAQSGAVALTISQPLNRAATWLSNDMAAKNYFSHTDQLGRDPNTRMANCDAPNANTAGENIAAGTQTAQQAFDNWKTSAQHNANMLNPSYRSIGISRTFNPATTTFGINNGYYWTTTFSSEIPGGAPPPPAVAPCSGPSISASPVSTAVPAGGTVVLTATATCGATANFQWWSGLVLPNGTLSWQALSQYSGSSVFSWAPTTPGTYYVGVWAKLQGTTPPSGFDASTSLPSPFTVAGANIPLVTPCTAPSIAASPIATTVSLGSTVNFSGNATCGGTGSYQWWVGFLLPNGTTSWQSVIPYGTSKTYTWTPTTPGIYYIGLWAKVENTNPVNGFDTSTSVTMTVLTPGGPAPCTTSTLLPSSTALAANQPVRFTAAATCGAAPNYEWWGGYVFFDGSIAWVQLTQYTATNTYDWVPTNPGTYMIGFWVKNAGSSPANGSYDLVTTNTYTVN